MSWILDFNYRMHGSFTRNNTILKMWWMDLCLHVKTFIVTECEKCEKYSKLNFVTYVRYEIISNCLPGK